MSQVVVVPKVNGDIRLCVDMRRANEAVIRERYAIPTIDDILTDLNHVKCSPNWISSGPITRSSWTQVQGK